MYSFDDDLGSISGGGVCVTERIQIQCRDIWRCPSDATVCMEGQDERGEGLLGGGIEGTRTELPEHGHPFECDVVDGVKRRNRG